MARQAWHWQMMRSWSISPTVAVTLQSLGLKKTIPEMHTNLANIMDKIEGRKDEYARKQERDEKKARMLLFPSQEYLNSCMWSSRSRFCSREDTWRLRSLTISRVWSWWSKSTTRKRAQLTFPGNITGLAFHLPCAGSPNHWARLTTELPERTKFSWLSIKGRC